RLARKNGIRYAVKKDKATDPPTYYIFFKGKSAEVIEATLQLHVYADHGNVRKDVLRRRQRNRRKACSCCLVCIFSAYRNTFIPSFPFQQRINAEKSQFATKFNKKQQNM
ncbi:MAG: PcfB family protein, partial [Firmicutes bacterium]|nr:PcfB family protein [Bacillota bacterium]